MISGVRKDMLRFSSNLEVDVVEVTDHDVPFVVPLTLDELLAMPDHTFPAVAQILTIPKVEHLVRSGWVEELRSRQELVLHGTGSVAMALLSSARRTKRQYFLVSEGYAGMFRRRPREFLSVFEVYMAATQELGLRVTVARSGREAENDMIGLVAGEVLEVVGFHVGGQGAQLQNAEQKGDVLICRRADESSDDEQEEEGVSSPSATVVLPLHWHGFFTEVISNNKKYKIRDLCQKFSLPLNVKVVSKGSDLAFDPLYGISSFRLEGITTETIIWASILTSPELCFIIPTRCLSMDIQFTQQALPWPKDEPPVCLRDTVIEVTESFYLEVCRLIYSQQLPPPRPPKTTNLSLAPKPCNPETQADCDQAPSVPRKPAIPSPTTSHHSVDRLQDANQQGEVKSEDSDHDYESGDLMDTIQKMQEFPMF